MEIGEGRLLGDLMIMGAVIFRVELKLVRVVVLMLWMSYGQLRVLESAFLKYYVDAVVYAAL